MKQKRGISRYLYTLVFLLLAVAVVTVTGSCGGGGGAGDGGGDGGGGGGGPTPLATGTFTKTADMGSTTYTGLLDADLYAHYQYLYLASNINGAGRITGLAIKYRSTMVTAVTCPNATIKLSHSNLANLTGTFANNLGTGQGSQTTVLNNATMTFPAGAAGSWQTILLATPFDYNGKDNLIIDVERTGACSGIVFDDVNTAWPYTAGVWTTTNGSATGTTAFWAANGKLVFAGGDNEQNYGGAINNYWPFSVELPRTQNLYLASDIDGSGPITGIAFQLNQVSTAQTFTYSVRMGHTTLAALGTTYANNYNAGSPVTLANAATFTVPAGIPAGGWFWVPLPNNTFTYNGTNNLIVEVEVTAGTGNIYLRTSNLGTANRAAGFAGSNVALGVDDTAYHIKLRFNGGTMDVIEPSLANYTVPFDGSGTGMVLQSLYGSYVLGTSGAINRVSLRLAADTAADVTYTGATITLGHTTLSDLTVTLANNMDDPRVVFTGNITIPGGLKVGDWINIPVSGFTYDPTKNLTLQLQSGTGPSSIFLIYGGSGVISNSGAATPGSATMGEFEGTRHPHMRLGVSK